MVERKLAQVDKQLQAQIKEMRQALVEPADKEIEEATAVLNDRLIRTFTTTLGGEAE